MCVLRGEVGGSRWKALNLSGDVSRLRQVSREIASEQDSR